jgi:outer membrane murein-binding lipoprotein Lpp
MDYDELVQRLRDPQGQCHDVGASGVCFEITDEGLTDDAADAIVQLQARIAELEQNVGNARHRVNLEIARAERAETDFAEWRQRFRSALDEWMTRYGL